jgi:hypothetical protein
MQICADSVRGIQSLCVRTVIEVLSRNYPFCKVVISREIPAIGYRDRPDCKVPLHGDFARRVAPPWAATFTGSLEIRRGELTTVPHLFEDVFQKTRSLRDQL